jgi:probable HAF family extracellular repeat protein
MKRFLCGLVVLGLVVGEAGQAKAQPGFSYSFTLFDAPGSVHGTEATGINNAGEIVGYYYDDRVNERGFLFSGGTYTSLAAPGSDGVTFPQGINNAGKIVGWDGGGNGFLFGGGNYTRLNVPGANDTFLRAINDDSQIVGSYSLGAFNHAFKYSAGSFTTLDVPGRFGSAALGINNAGQIVGAYSDSPNRFQGFLSSGGAYTMIDVPGAFYTSATGINNAGEIVGWYWSGVGGGVIPRGFLLKDGVYTLFDVPGSGATDLLGINDLGQIVGYYGDDTGTHGFLATPVPEPSTLLLLGIAMVGLIGWAWRTRSASRTAGRQV